VHTLWARVLLALHRAVVQRKARVPFVPLACARAAIGVPGTFRLLKQMAGLYQHAATRVALHQCKQCFQTSKKA
jgi:hypothetical protein